MARASRVSAAGNLKGKIIQMTLSISDLPESVVANYEETARNRGISLDVFLRDLLIEHATPSASLRAESKAAGRFGLLREKIVASGIPLLGDGALRAEIVFEGA